MAIGNLKAMSAALRGSVENVRTQWVLKRQDRAQSLHRTRMSVGGHEDALRAPRELLRDFGQGAQVAGRDGMFLN